jgi:DNA polymerase-1
MIDYDVETTGLQPWSGKCHAFMFQFFDPEVSPNAEALYPGVDDERIQWWFDRGAKFGIRAWNTKFDRAFGDISPYNIPSDGVWYDGMVEAHTINERRSVALKAVGEELLGSDRREYQKEVKVWLTKERARRKKEATDNGTELIEPNYSDVPRELMEPYGLEDVYLTREIGDTYEPILKQSPSLQGVYDFERNVLDALYAMEKRGLPADVQGYRKLELEVIENLDALEERVIELAKEGTDLQEFNPRSSAQVIDALRQRGANMAYMVTSDGEIKSADKENLEAVDDDLAKAILEFRAEFKTLSTYVRPFIGRHYSSELRMWKEQFVADDGRVHANYRQVGARTGRMSCSDPNMQNQPRDDLRLRYNIRAEEGYKLVACDLSNIEMRLFAAYAGQGRMLDAVREGADLHVQTAEFIGIKDRKRAGGDVESARQRGKTFNFSIVYGGGLRTIKRQQRVDQNEARLMRRRYYEAYPEIEKLQQRIEFRLEDQGYIQDLWGRRYRCTNPRKEAYKFVNYLIQGTAAQVLKAAVVALHKDGVPVVALVHDEIVAHAPKNDAPEVEQLIIKRLTEQSAPGGLLWLENEGKAIVPLDADGGIFDRWSDAKPLKDGSLFVPKWANA